MFDPQIHKLKDSVWTGVAIGFLAPLIPGLLVWYLIQNVSLFKHADLLLIGCVAINAFLMNFFFKRNKDSIARGIISITFFWAFIFFFYKVR